MKAFLATSLLIQLLFTASASPAAFAADFQGQMATEAMLFFHQPVYEGQDHYVASVAVEAEMYHEFPTGSQIIITPFYRFDSADSTRTHGDLRVCKFSYVADQWFLDVGFDKVFWGVTEFVHLVDIINQTDMIESIDGEAKLGQPMVHLGVERDWGVLDGFLLPYFRERTFPGSNGRLRGSVVVDGSSSSYESDSGQNHLDFALRYSHTLGNWDVGIYQFYGTSRDPIFMGVEGKKDTVAPYYELIYQTGLDLQFIHNQWLWKLEALYRSAKLDSGGAAVCGFEYTLVGVLDTALDIGLITEYICDDRGLADTSLYDNDVMLGMRISVNDPASTEILVGVIKDIKRNSTALTCEYSRRLTNSFKLELSLALFDQIAKDDPVSSYRDDSFVKIQATYYF